MIKFYGGEDYVNNRIPFKVFPAFQGAHENLSVKFNDDTKNTKDTRRFITELGATLLAIQEAERESSNCSEDDIPSSYTSDHRLKLTLDGEEPFSLEDGLVFRETVLYELFSASTIDIDYYFSWDGDYFGYQQPFGYRYNFIPITFYDIADRYKEELNLVYRRIYQGTYEFQCCKIENGVMFDPKTKMSRDISDYRSYSGWSSMDAAVIAWNTAIYYPKLLEELRDTTCACFPKEICEATKAIWEPYSPEDFTADDQDAPLNMLVLWSQYFIRSLGDFQGFLDYIYFMMRNYRENPVMDGDYEAIPYIQVSGEFAQLDKFSVARWENTDGVLAPVGIHF